MDPNEVRMIFKDTYNFYLKWKNGKEEDAFQIHKESKEINQKYNNCDLCRGILVELCSILHQGMNKKEEV